jgi:hypothetical protein
MNIIQLKNKLIAAARSRPLDDRVPYAFEKRILARLQGARIHDVWDVWAAGLWRAAVPCVAITLLLSAWSLLPPDNSSGSDFSQELDNTVLAAIEPDQPTDSLQ